MSVKADDSVPSRRARLVGTVALVVVIVTPGVLTWLWGRPRPTLPTELPALALTHVAAQLALDAASAEEAPRSALAEARLAAYREANEAELDANDRPGPARARRDRLIAALDAVVAEHGEEVRTAVREADLERAMAVLHGELEGVERDEELGSLILTLERYGMVVDGRQVAPRFVIRTVFKARWNAGHGRPLTEGLSDAEVRAYWGWLALEAEGAPLEQRLAAVEPYAAAGGERALEARGILLLRLGRRDEAAEAFERAAESDPTFRLRNYALAARAP